MKIIIYEDESVAGLFPLTLNRASFELRCGGTLLFEKIIRQCHQKQVHFLVRDEISEITAERLGSNLDENKFTVNDADAVAGDDLMIINGRVLLFSGELPPPGEGEMSYEIDGETALVRIKKTSLVRSGAKNLENLLRWSRENLQKKNLSGRMIAYPWDLVRFNSEAIADDFSFLPPLIGNPPLEFSIIGDPGRLCIGDNIQIDPFVVVDTREGPVIIENDVKIFPFSRLEGPCFIGEGTHITGANLRGGTSIGPECRIGGELEESIVHGFSNKYHDGFLGHAYVGEWVNLGAGTNNSDLKNNYNSVKVRIGNMNIDTGLPKVGSFIGDHSKTSIGTSLNTGTVIGIMCNIVGTGALSPPFIPSFSWFRNGQLHKPRHGSGPFIETAEKVKARRGSSLTEAEIALYEKIFRMTEQERQAETK